MGFYDADKPLTAELRKIALRELDYVIGRQTNCNDDAFSRQDLRGFCETYLNELQAFSWERPNQQIAPAPRPLRHFINLFLLEAFIRRQAD